MKKKRQYKGAGRYDIYSDIYLDVFRRGEEGFLAANLYETARDKHNFVHLPNLLAMIKLQKILTKLIKLNKWYYKAVGEEENGD